MIVSVKMAPHNILGSGVVFNDGEERVLGSLSCLSYQFASLMSSPVANFPSSGSPELTIYIHTQRQDFSRCSHWQKTLGFAVPWRTSLPRALYLPSTDKILVLREPCGTCQPFLLGFKQFFSGRSMQETLCHAQSKVFVVHITCFLSSVEELVLLLFDQRMGTLGQTQWGGAGPLFWPSVCSWEQTTWHLKSTGSWKMESTCTWQCIFQGRVPLLDACGAT
jgi:hypothetical protein